MKDNLDELFRPTEEEKSILIEKFRSGNPIPTFVCNKCGEVFGKHFGTICPTKDQLSHIQTPEEEMRKHKTFYPQTDDRVKGK